MDGGGRKVSKWALNYCNCIKVGQCDTKTHSHFAFSKTAEKWLVRVPSHDGSLCFISIIQSGSCLLLCSCAAQSCDGQWLWTPIQVWAFWTRLESADPFDNIVTIKDATHPRYLETTRHSGTGWNWLSICQQTSGTHMIYSGGDLTTHRSLLFTAGYVEQCKYFQRTIHRFLEAYYLFAQWKLVESRLVCTRCVSWIRVAR